MLREGQINESEIIKGTKLSFGRVNRRFYSRKFRLMANTVIFSLKHFFTFPFFEMYFFAPIVSAFGNVNPDINQSKATFHNDVGFATVYRRIYCRIFLTLSTQTSRYIRKCRIRIMI